MLTTTLWSHSRILWPSQIYVGVPNGYGRETIKTNWQKDKTDYIYSFRPDPFGVEFACSPHALWVFSGYSGFLPQPQNMHGVRVIIDSKLAIGVNVSVVDCLLLALRWTGSLSKVYTTLYPMTAGVGSRRLDPVYLMSHLLIHWFISLTFI